MIEFIIGTYACYLSTVYTDFQKLAEFDRQESNFGAIHCTDWGKKAAREIGYSYNGRVWNGWLVTSGQALEAETATGEEIRKIKSGWLVEFVNHNSANGRHAVIVQRVLSQEREYIDVIGVGSFNGKVSSKIYRLGTRASKAHLNTDYLSTFNVPVIATYKPIKNE